MPKHCRVLLCYYLNIAVTHCWQATPVRLFRLGCTFKIRVTPTAMLVRWRSPPLAPWTKSLLIFVSSAFDKCRAVTTLSTARFAYASVVLRWEALIFAARAKICLTVRCEKWTLTSAWYTARPRNSSCIFFEGIPENSHQSLLQLTRCIELILVIDLRLDVNMKTMCLSR